MVYHGLSWFIMVYPWFIHGLSWFIMAYPWLIHGLSMAYPCGLTQWTSVPKIQGAVADPRRGFGVWRQEPSRWAQTEWCPMVGSEVFGLGISQ